MHEMGRGSRVERTRKLNNTLRYTMWSVFALVDRFAATAASDNDTEIEEVLSLFAQLEVEGVSLRGLYDVAGFRADAEVLVWLHAESADQLQDAYHRIGRTRFGRRLQPVWSQMALHRPAEFNSSRLLKLRPHLKLSQGQVWCCR